MNKNPPVRPNGLHIPHPERLDPASRHYAERLDAHAAALRAEQPGYIDPIDGLFVFTSAYFLNRGTCCDNKCRHCPYLGEGPP